MWSRKWKKNYDEVNGSHRIILKTKKNICPRWFQEWAQQKISIIIKEVFILFYFIFFLNSLESV